MRYHTVIIGAGMSGLAAGIRLAYYEKPVCIVERHTTIGGLNSFYRLRGRNYDVGLHAVTNYAPPGTRSGPLAKLLKQLRLRWDDFDLAPQVGSSIVFPEHRLAFNNDFTEFVENVSREFPQQADRFRRLVALIDDFDETRLTQHPLSARGVLSDFLSDPVLADMLLCPLMYYGSATPRDMDFNQFCIMFKSIYQQGLARPLKGVRQILKTLTRRYKELGGELMLRHGVREITTNGRRATGVVLDDGREIEAEHVLSSAGLMETLGLLRSNFQEGEVPHSWAGEAPHSRAGEAPAEPDMESMHILPRGSAYPEGAHSPSRGKSARGEISFNEAIFVLDCQPRALGHDQTIVFYNNAERFDYERPTEPLDLRSGIICSPNNFGYAGGQQLDEGLIRLTALANPDYWMSLSDDEYYPAKAAWAERMIESAVRHIPDFRDHMIETDIFTPRTIKKFTGHLQGAVYGAPQKVLNGKTEIDNLYLCGTDQGFLGIVGAMLSGITMANAHLLR